MRKIITSICLGLALLIPSWSYAGGCGYRQNFRSYHNYYDNVVELIVVQPQVQYLVDPEVDYDKVERVVEVKEVERVRIVRQNKVANLLRQIVVPVIIKEKVHY